MLAPRGSKNVTILQNCMWGFGKQSWLRVEVINKTHWVLSNIYPNEFFLCKRPTERSFVVMIIATLVFLRK